MSLWFAANPDPPTTLDWNLMVLIAGVRQNLIEGVGGYWKLVKLYAADAQIANW